MIRSMLRNTSAGIPPIELTDFLITVKTDNAGVSANDQFTISTNTGGFTYDYDVITSDGQYITGNTGNLTITFPTAGNYDIAIRGQFPGFFTGNSFDKLKLLDIKQWGNISWETFADAFNGCTNLTGTFTDTPNLAGVTSLFRAFGSCSNFEGNLSSWNVSTITDFRSLFQNCAKFNSNISGWNVANGTQFSSMFNGATIFNQDISGWAVSGITTINGMFLNAKAFNQSLNTWDVSGVTNLSVVFLGASAFNGNISSWNTASATTMNSMFSGASVFNQDISGWNTGNVLDFTSMFFNAFAFNQNIGGWDVSKATNMSNMFRSANAFNQNIGIWNVIAVTNMQNMFFANNAFNQNIGSWNVVNVINFVNFMGNKTVYDAANLDSIYNGWSLLTLKPNIDISFNTIKYTAAGQAGRDILTGAPNNWTITDGGI